MLAAITLGMGIAGATESSGGLANGARVQVMPEVTTEVVMSNTDINRITCPDGELVKDVVYSTEKAVSVKIEGSNAFVKFLIVKDTITGEQRYRTAPVELYVVCGDSQVFTIIAAPKNVPATHVQLVSDVKRIKKNISLFDGIPFERKAVMIIQKVYTDDIPASFTIKKVNRPVRAFKDINVILARVVDAEGEGLQLREYVLSLKKAFKQGSISLSEKQFLVPELTENPVAIALEAHTLKRERPMRLFILERRAKS